VIDRVDAVTGAGDGVGVSDVSLLEFDFGRAIVGVYQVEDADLRAACDESPDQIRSQVSGAAGYELQAAKRRIAHSSPCVSKT